MTLTPMTKQEIFDAAATHLLDQAMQALDEGGNCCYRGPEGLKCAVGCLIPDELYDPAMEDKLAYAVLADSAPLRLLFLGDDSPVSWPSPRVASMQYPVMCLLEDLQRLHDCRDAACWLEDLRRIADDHQLDPDVLPDTI